MAWIEANGASLRYELSGSGNETLVLVHEAGGCLESYEEALPTLQKAFRVLRYDQRGFGFSEKARDLSFDGVIADLAALLDALAIKAPICLAGCGMGADFSVGFAARHPGRDAKLGGEPAEFNLEDGDGHGGRGPSDTPQVLAENFPGRAVGADPALVQP